jgi:hypothetical protein
MCRKYYKYWKEKIYLICRVKLRINIIIIIVVIIIGNFFIKKIIIVIEEKP